MGLFTRSGLGVALVSEALGWRADHVIQVGVGDRHEEVGVIKKAWPGVQFYGFDPRPADSYDGRFYKVAISDKPGFAMFNLKARHKDGSSLYPIPGQPDATQVEVQKTALDLIFPSPLEGNILLWLDCEGSELDALHGAEQFIQYVQLVNVEFSATLRYYKDRYHSLEIYRWLRDHGFWMVDNHTQRLQEGQCDYVFCREHIFKPELCLSPQEIERWLKEHPE